VTGSPERFPARLDEPGQVVLRARFLVGAAVLGVLVVLALTELLPTGDALVAAAPPAALLGLVSPVVGYRLYLWVRERAARPASRAERCGAFVRANLVAMAVTEGAALFGIVAYLLSGRLFPLVGVLTHVLLAGAIWPSAEKLDLFLRPPDEPLPAGDGTGGDPRTGS